MVIDEMAVNVKLLGLKELDDLLVALDRNFDALPADVQKACKALADVCPDEVDASAEKVLP